MTITLLNNRYQVIQVLGAGGFGETFLAEDTYMPSCRRCVIKQLKPMTNDPQLYQLIQQRFQREAATLETLGEGSSQIPKLYAYFSEQGQFYLVQEWIQGQTLSDKVEAEGPLNETVVREILVNLLQVLNYVHSKGIIYRDIKPDNIILRQSNNQPVLIDFGAVKETMVTAINTQGKATHTIVIGTPGFMAPEQAAGRPTYASDIYSLGMTAIYLLTGKLPQELEADSQTEKILWQQHALKVSPRLITVIDKAVQYSPRDRYTTARKMLDDLHSAVPVSSPPATTQATAILLPPGGKAASKSASQVYPATVERTIRPPRQGNWQRNLILGSLLAGGLLSAAVVFSLGNDKPPQSSTITSPLPPSPSEQPIATTSTPVADSPEPALEPTLSPSVPVAVSPPTPVSELPSATPKQQNPGNSSPPVREAPQQQNPENSSAPVREAPQQSDRQNDFAKNVVTNNVPAFPVGSSQSQVKATLGNPTKTSRGIWFNTRAYIYELEPNQITLGYLFDRTSGRLRQTEVSFAQSISPELMQATLQGMLGDRSSTKANQGLQQVYQRRTNNYTFNVGGLEGAIQRNDRDRIYIGVWDADLH